MRIAVGDDTAQSPRQRGTRPVARASHGGRCEDSLWRRQATLHNSVSSRTRAPASRRRGKERESRQAGNSNWRDDWVTAVPSSTFPSIRFSVPATGPIVERGRKPALGGEQAGGAFAEHQRRRAEDAGDFNRRLHPAEIGDRARVDQSLVAMNELGEASATPARTVDCAPWCRDDGDPRWGFHGCGRPCEGGSETCSFGLRRPERRRLRHPNVSIRREQGRLAEVAPVVKSFVDEKIPARRLGCPASR